ncbi:SGNH/GDSL hydrolase family protein [Spirosoma pollinicola]|uniref:SGNH/GDSL hydrolase family protein n=1 Tax=Spirosoma pollinicola TaxID=2057025 RepID=A0A2K8Z3W8_9BACT|nr:SGNH/GDSL hydrolase family protein [Spirosoma pollinicola]AUD04558.1 SGNH/GDSL hydrolase family protein [Spirosoma pollinicola]
MKNIYCLIAFALLFTSCNKLAEPQPTNSDSEAPARSNVPLIVILGSSTASGFGASTYNSSWAGQLKAYYTKKMPVINLAKPGYTTYHILPTNATQVANRPAVDTTRNITAALEKNPTILIISMTTNDVSGGYRVDELMSNLKTVRDLAMAKGVKQIYITTSHPRKISSAATAKYMEQRDRIINTYGKYAINFFNPVADSTNLFRSELLSSDGIHPNDDGHKILFDQVRTALEQL